MPHGIRHVVPARPIVWIEFLVAAGLAPVGIGIPLLYRAWRRWDAESRIPIVAFAAPPVMRFHGGPPLRSCAVCLEIASAVAINHSFASGSVYTYACSGCARRFRVGSPIAVGVEVLLFAIPAAGATALFCFARSRGARWGLAGVLGFIAMIVAAEVALQLRDRRRNPVVPDA